MPIRIVSLRPYMPHISLTWRAVEAILINKTSFMAAVLVS